MHKLPVDTVSLQELRDIMGEEFSLLIDVFINDSQQRISALAAAIEACDAGEVRAIAHGFKGSALNLSALPLTELCRQLEAMGRDGQLAGAAEVFEQLVQEFERVKNYLPD